MIGLFVSDDCPSCRHIIHDIPESWASQVTVLRVEFDQETGYYRVSDGDKLLEGRAPINTVPTLWISDTKEIYSGYSKIMNRLEDVNR